jgi:hypothetical protein
MSKSIAVFVVSAGVLAVAAVGVHCGGSSDTGQVTAADGGGAGSGEGGTGEAGAGEGGGGDGGVVGEVRTLANCTTSIAADAPAFYKKYFRCVTVTTTADGVTVATTDLPPHLSNYYGVGNPNYAPFDTSRGAAYHANPNFLKETASKITVPNAPVAKGVIVTEALVDGLAQTSPLEFGLGPVGVALDSVAMFNAVAAPGDKIDTERFTFDSYEAHPAPNGGYHYHSASPGPLEVLAANGLIVTPKVGSAELEVYGIMCDGTVVLGCTELDGTARVAAGLDAQGGHVHDLKDKDGVVHFANRYHAHVCAKDGGRAYTPEIQYYSTCVR